MFAGERGRSERRSERYYARNNDPSFPQFSHTPYHFVDDQRRQYMIATRDGAPFNNTRFKPTGGRPGAQKRCQLNSDGHVTLFVKLPRQTGRWFETRQIGQTLLLQRKDDPREQQLVRLRQAIKPSVKRRTGTVVVSHLSETYCNRLLNLPRAPSTTTPRERGAAGRRVPSQGVRMRVQPPMLNLV